VLIRLIIWTCCSRTLLIKHHIVITAQTPSLRVRPVIPSERYEVLQLLLYQAHHFNTQYMPHNSRLIYCAFLVHLCKRLSRSDWKTSRETLESPGGITGLTHRLGVWAVITIWCFINKVQEQHVQIINLINTISNSSFPVRSPPLGRQIRIISIPFIICKCELVKY